MTGYLISEAARETGFTESALRFYEQEGVVVPERNATGYRSYGDAHLESLRFVARGKQLGLSLEEITELLDGVRLKTGHGGVFTIRVDSEEIYDKTQGFDLARIIGEIEARL